MTALAVRSRLFTAGGGLLAVAGLAATMAVGPAAFASDAGVTANAEVASTITLTATEAAFTLAGAPGDPATAFTPLTAESNSGTGYNVTVQADQEALVPNNGALTDVDPGYNGDTIPVAALHVQNSGSTPTPLSNTAAATVHTQTDRSIVGGDALTASYSLAMPWVNADTYSGGLTFTAAANG